MVRGDQRPIRVGQRPADADRAHKGSRDQDPAPAAARLFILVELVAVVCLGLSVGMLVMGGLLERRRAVRRQVVSKIVATLVLLAPLLRRVGRLIVAVVRIGLRRGKVIGRPRLGGLAVIGISLRGPWDLRWDLRWNLRLQGRLGARIPTAGALSLPAARMDRSTEPCAFPLQSCPLAPLNSRVYRISLGASTPKSVSPEASTMALACTRARRAAVSVPSPGWIKRKCGNSLPRVYCV